MNLTLTEYIQGVEKWDLDPLKVVYEYLEKAKSKNSTYNAYIHFLDQYVEQNIDEFKSKPLKAAPIAVKDNILIKGYRATCASKYLEDFISPYTATHIQYLEKWGGLSIGKTNMDEFAMGWSWEHSYFGPARNPHDIDRVPGGSSSWSAVAVAADLALAAIGSDTWGSIRQPAALTGIVGVKPTYGRVSRFGVQAMASSLDQVGTFWKTVSDAALLLKYISWWDSKDATSLDMKDIDKWEEIIENFRLKGTRVAIPNQFLWEWLEEGVRERFMEILEILKQQGVEIDFVDFQELDLALAIYYILMPAEVSTNLARLDGIKYWLQKNTFEWDSIYDYYEDIRAEGFWAETKRRILIGTYVLSEGYYDAYYRRALKLRNRLKKKFDLLLRDYDFVLSPTSPVVAWKIWERVDDPIKMYLADVYTVPVNLVGVPGMSLPMGKASKEDKMLPIWLQIIANVWEEGKMFGFAKRLEELGLNSS